MRCEQYMRLNALESDAWSTVADRIAGYQRDLVHLELRGYGTRGSENSPRCERDSVRQLFIRVRAVEGKNCRRTSNLEVQKRAVQRRF